MTVELDPGGRGHHMIIVERGNGDSVQSMILTDMEIGQLAGDQRPGILNRAGAGGHRRIYPRRSWKYPDRESSHCGPHPWRRHRRETRAFGYTIHSGEAPRS